MAVDIFLKLGSITGEARDKDHNGEIDVLAWSWGMTLKMNRGGGGPVRAPEVEQMQITKYLDRASPALMTSLVNVTPHTAVIVCRKASGVKTDALEYLRITMEGAVVTSVRPAGMGADERFTETITLDFGKVSVTYKEQGDKGIAKGGAVDFAYDLKSNR